MPLVDIPEVGKVNFPDDMSQADILKAIQNDILPKAKPIEVAKPAGFSAKETGLALGQGIVGAGKSLADVFGAENVVSQGLGKVQNVLGEQYSPERKAEMARRQQLQEQASKSGNLTEEIGTFLAGVAEAPVQSLAQGIGSIVPFVGTGILGAIGKLGAPTVRALNAVIGSGMGAGSVKGSLYDSVKQELEKSGMRPEEAAARASKAQEYLGENFLDIAAGAALGGVESMFGVEKALTPGAAQKLSSRLIPRVSKAALAEAPLEGVQGGQEQLAINRALQKEGFDVGTFQSVGGAAARDAAIGALTGAAVGVRGPAPVITPKTEEQKKAEEERKALEITQTRDETQAADKKIISALEPRFDAEGNPIAGAPPSAIKTTPLAEETIDVAPVKKSGMTIEQLEADNARIQTGLDAGNYKNTKAVTAAKNKIARQQAEIDALKGEANVIQPTDTGTSGVSTAVPGGPAPVATAAGAGEAGLGRPGVVSDQGVESTSQDGAGAQQSALDPYGSFFKWVAQKGINLPEGPTYDFPELVQQWGTETNQPQDVINELAGVEEVIDEQALADQETKAAEAAAAEEARLSAEEQATIEEEAAAELAGEVTPPVTREAQTPEDFAVLQEAIDKLDVKKQIETQVEAAKQTKTTEKKPVPLVIEADQDASTPEAQTKRNDVVAKVNAFEDIRKLLSAPEKLGTLDKKVKPAGVQGEVIKEEKVAKPIKWRGEKGTKTKNPSPYNFLNENGYYSDKSPEQIAEQSVEIAKKDKKAAVKDALEAGVESAAFDEAYDLYDSIAYDEKVLPEIKAVMAQRQAAKDAEVNALNEERNNNREAKRAQMTRDGKSEKVIKEALSVIKDVPKVKYQETKPLEFMSEQEVLDLFKKNVGTKTETQMAKEGGQARIDAAKNRNAFVDVLSPVEKIKFGMMTESILDMEIISAVQDNKVTTAGDRRTQNYRKKQEKAIIDDVKEQLKQAELTVEEREKKEQAKAARIAKRAEEKKQERAQVTKEVETEEAEAKSKLVVGIEKGIVEGSLDTVLEVIADKKKQVNESTTRNIAQSFIDLVSDFGNITIQFGKVSKKNADGEFNPKTNTITIKGENGVYTGERSLDETVLHETGHYLTDHIFDSKENQKAYLDGIKDPAKRKAAQAAINRLDNNYRLVKSKLGDKFNIPTIKEFIAEIYSNPRFQEAVAALDTGKLGIDYTTIKEINGKEEVIGTNREIPGPVKQYVLAKENLFQKIVKNIANVLGFNISEKEGFVNDPARAVILKQSIEDIARIISLPTADIRSTKISYSEKKEKEEKALRVSDYDNPGEEYKPSEALAPKNWRWFKERFFTRPGWRKIAYEFQNDRYYIKLWEDSLQVANKIKHGLNEKFNNIYTQLTLATSAASNLYKKYLANTVDELDSAIMKYAQASKLTTDEVLAKLHVLYEALHEPERRMVKYIMNVPLRDPAADRRTEILDLIRANNKITKAEAKQLRDELQAIVNNPKNLDTASKKPTDIDNAEYNVLGIDLEAAKLNREKYEADPHKALMDEVLAKVKDLNVATAELNKMANYWSQPVTNIVNFYGWNYYTPFKGKKYARHGVADELLDFDSERNGKELQEVAYSFDGSTQIAENPVLQVLAEASRSAARAGRKDLTQSILNAITPDANGKKLLQGEVKQTIKFEDRYNIKDILKDINRENTVFHYKDDGSIDVIEINDKQLRESIRRTYKDSNPMVDIANTITSRLGQLHTRYNYNFAPMNFVRDALTNAWTLGADMGPGKTAEFIRAITGSVISGGLTNKARKIAYMLQKNDIEGIEKLKNVRGYEEMADYVLNSGMVSYLESLTAKSNFEQIQKRLGKNKIVLAKDGLDTIVDTWTDMFEIASRAAAFGVVKKAAMDENIKNGMSKKDAEAAANVRAAGYVKNLANFEQVGEYGKAMGAFYMFFRPSATGAVRAIEAVAPAFPGSLERAITDLPPHIQQPENEADAKALADFKVNYAQKQQNARIMVSALIGMGMLAYTMSAMMADDDDLGRNKLMTDNMDQWTRFWRIHVPGMKEPIQIPWGFGLGSFAAAGAQLASVFSGHQSAGKALANVFLQVSLDSFVPIPVSRMPPADNPLAFAIDSVAPSTVRPVIEFLINKNGLGQDIYNSATGRRMGDAFLGGDRIPEMYKNAAAAMWDATNGAINISPNTMYFLSNSYADGVARIFEGTFGITDTVSGRKEFSPKTDIPLFGSFFGAEANVDGREWASVKKQIEQKVENMGSAELNPARYARYISSNPFDEIIVEFYNKDTAELNQITQAMNEVRLEENLSPKEKQALLKVFTLEQNLIKRRLIEQYKAYDIKP